MTGASHRLSLDDLMRRAVAAARDGMADGLGGPFGAVVARKGAVIAVGANRVVRDHDPTAHAEVSAIRTACEVLGDHRLTGCDIVSTCEPCPMCLSAIFWARIDRIYYGTSRHDAARAGFDDALIYREVRVDMDERRIPMIHLPSHDSADLFNRWREMIEKIPY